jgi:hypothetical protein
MNNVRGTVTFISDTTVSPIIRVYGLFSGIKRGLGALAGLGQRGGGGKGRQEGQKK